MSLLSLWFLNRITVFYSKWAAFHFFEAWSKLKFKCIQYNQRWKRWQKEKSTNQSEGKVNSDQSQHRNIFIDHECSGKGWHFIDVMQRWKGSFWTIYTYLWISQDMVECYPKSWRIQMTMIFHILEYNLIFENE